MRIALERKQLDVIERSADRMYGLIHDLLDTAAIEAGHVRLTRSRRRRYELVIDAIELLRPLAAAKRIELLADVPPGLPPIMADAARVLQVFSNIAGNAIKFTPPGGRVEFGVTEQGPALAFTIADNGPGIAASDLRISSSATGKRRERNPWDPDSVYRSQNVSSRHTEARFAWRARSARARRSRSRFHSRSNRRALYRRPPMWRSSLIKVCDVRRR